jgi:serine/threonine-protein kinase RsbW
MAMTMSLPRQPGSVTRARNVLTTPLSLTEATEESASHLAILISKACANAVTHAAGRGSPQLLVA